MGTYSVSEVEKLTGIRSHTLRMWERRYDFLSSDRTSTNIRAYNDDQLKKLLNVTILIRHGFKLSKLNQLTNERIINLVIEILDAQVSAFEDEIQGLTLAMIDMDEVRFFKILNKQISGIGLLNAISKIIYPFLEHVGSLWRTNRTVPANEHFVSNLIRRRLLAAIDNLPIAPQRANRLLLLNPEGEAHELGLILADYIARKAGWSTYYLGQNVPSSNIGDVLKQLTPDLVFSMFVIPRSFKQDKDLLDFIEKEPIPWICSGNMQAALDLSSSLKYLANPTELMEYLNRFDNL